MRTPSPIEALNVFMECLGEPVESVIDVGVNTDTKCLMHVFRSSHHYLFEPVTDYHDIVRSNYERAGLSYTLIECAVSDRSGIMYQHLLSFDNSGVLTHSKLLTSREPERFGSTLLGIKETPVVTLDQWADGKALGNRYIVKIDVDGVEDQIIEGGTRLISNAALVMVEAHLNKLAARAKRLQELGLRLFDIVGNGYYCDQLQQVDLIFIPEALVERNIHFRPWEKTGGIIWEKWGEIE